MSRGKAAGNKKGPKIALDPVKEATFRQHQANYFAGMHSPMLAPAYSIIPLQLDWRR